MKILKLTFMALVIVLGSLSSQVGASPTSNSDLKQEENKGNAVMTQNDEIMNSKNAIIYGPKNNPKGIVTIFTDIDCGYCRKLHHEIKRLTQSGIQVRYLAYPRFGVGTPSYNKIVTVWCSKDKAEAMDKAMQGETLPQQNCENPIYEHMSLGRKLKIMGTPTIIFTDGTKWPGYVPADKIAEEAIITQQVSDKNIAQKSG